MRTQMGVVMAMGALVCASVAFAGPRVLSGSQMDAVAAGQTVEAYQTEASDVAIADNGAIALQGDANTVSLADASHSGIATVGDLNSIARDANVVLLPAESAAAVGIDNEVYKVEQDVDGYAIIIGDDAHILGAKNDVGSVTDGSAGVVGEGNQVTVASEDTTIIYAEIAGYGITSVPASSLVDGGDNLIPIAPTYGVIAGEADVEHSFNVDAAFTEVEACIECSFNTETNSASIAGQNHVQAIANANTLGLQNVGTLLGVTTATATGPSISVEVADLSGLGAAAITVADQGVVNSSCVDLTLQAGSTF